jgi:hypothetical protein
MIESLLNDWAQCAQSLGPLKLYGGVVVLIALILLFLRFCRNRQPKNVTAYSTAGGHVIVNRAAIIDLVQSTCSQINDVSKPRVRIRIKKGTPHFQVQIKLSSGGRLRDIEQSLQEHLRDALNQNLGIEKLGKIDVIATGFKSSHPSKMATNLSVMDKNEPAEAEND